MCARALITNANIVTSGTLKSGFGVYLNEDGRIADVFSMEDFDRSKYHGVPELIDAKGALLCPGLIDTHIHGVGGFSTEDCDPKSILGMSDCLARFGVTGFLPTLYAGSPEKMIPEIKAITAAMGKEKGARILGINLEGPFLNPAKAGAQDKDALCKPDESIFIRLIEAGEGNIVCMTIAAELPKAENIATIAKENGIRLLMGHSAATYSQAKTAMEWGISNVTHMFNGMSPLDHKDPGLSGAALMDDRMHCELIADGVHVHRDVVRHVIASKADGNVILITDSLKPAGLGRGTFTANGTSVTFGDRGAFVDSADPSKLCGSALTLNRAVANVVKWGEAPAKAVQLASGNPAQYYGFNGLGSIAKGNMADLVIFNNEFEPSMVFIGGRQIYRKQEGKR